MRDEAMAADGHPAQISGQPMITPTGVAADRGPFYASWGPRDGLIVSKAAPSVMGAFDTPGADRTAIGLAYSVGSTPQPKAAVATFRLVVRDRELDGEWVCWGGEFVRIGKGDVANWPEPEVAGAGGHETRRLERWVCRPGDRRESVPPPPAQARRRLAGLPAHLE